MNSRGRAKGVSADSVIPFCKKMAFLMLTNTINNEGRIVRDEERLLRSRKSVMEEHRLETRPVNTGKWHGNSWSEMKQPYQKLQCKGPAAGEDGCKKWSGCIVGTIGQSPCATSAIISIATRCNFQLRISYMSHAFF